MPAKLADEERSDPVRIYQRKLYKFGKSIENQIFPILPHELFYATAVWVVLDAIGFGPLSGITEVLEKVINRMGEASVLVRLVCALTVAIPALFISIFALRFIITLSLYYHGWLFETIGKPPSLSTKVFMFMISVLKKRAKYFSWQDLLPWMLPPRVEDTVTKYLETVRPLLDDEKFTEMKDQAEEFKSTIANRLQRKLWMKWLISKNYISDWWKEVVYMRYRNSLIKTNVACADIIYFKTTTIQAARAAYITLSRQYFCRDVYSRENMKPITLGGIPLCTTQYLDYHRSLRVPCETSDKMIRVPDARHIAVYREGCWYKVNIYNGKRLIGPAELEKALQAIIDLKHTSAPGEKYLSALTAGPRDLWARIRRDKFAKGGNKEGLSLIENALEIVFLDDEERGYDEEDTSKYNREYARSLTGDGYLLWCDKPSVYLFSANGRFTSNAEHSVVDAMVYVHVREYIKYHENKDKPYGPDGHCVGELQHVPQPERIHFDLDQETLEAINEAYIASKKVAEDFENSNIVFNDYGKDFMKKAKVSPDAYIQMALQMAYYKDQGKFELTYEPAVMRLFKDGRTETVRSCSSQSCEFVKSMLDKESDDNTRINLLEKACDRHQEYYRNAMAGHGVDRHLFALYVVSKYYEIPSPFLDNVFSMNYALSTSQTPQHQTEEFSKTMNNDKILFWPAGAFACPDGSNYGVCYTIGTTGDCLSFHVSSWKSLTHTDPQRFLNHLVDSLREMREMIDKAA